MNRPEGRIWRETETIRALIMDAMQDEGNLPESWAERVAECGRRITAAAQDRVDAYDILEAKR
jgi:hypothetical protein